MVHYPSSHLCEIAPAAVAVRPSKNIYVKKKNCYIIKGSKNPEPYDFSTPSLLPGSYCVRKTRIYPNTGENEREREKEAHRTGCSIYNIRKHHVPIYLCII